MGEIYGGPLPAGMEPIPNADKPMGCLTKRELFAAMAMQGILSNVHVDQSEFRVASGAVKCADALLQALAK